MALRDALQSCGISQTDLAREVGARPETVSRWVAGRMVPRAETVASLLAVFNRPENLRKLDRRTPVTFADLFSEAA